MHSKKKPVRIIISDAITEPGVREWPAPVGAGTSAAGAPGSAGQLEAPCSTGRHAFIQATASTPDRTPSIN